MTIRDLSSWSRATVPSADVAVVGAGPAGITLALELKRRGARVVLLEAGGREQSSVSQERYAGEVLTPPHLDYPPLDGTRLRMLGGSSNHWNGWCRPIEADVFAPRPWISEVGWPFGFAELERDYVAAHDRCDLGRFEYDPARLSAETGQSLLTEGMEHARTVVFRYSTPTRFAEKYGPDLESEGIDVVLNANVVAFRTHRNYLRRVVVVDEPGGHEIEVAAERFVIACGGVETVRLLAELEATTSMTVNSGGWLGTGFMEHPHAFLGALMLPGSRPANASDDLAFYRSRVRDVDGTEIRAALSLDPTTNRELGLINISLTLESTTGMQRAQMESATAVGELVGLSSGGDEAVLFRLFGRTEQRPVAESTLRRVRATDDLGLRRLRLDWRVSDQDLHDLEVCTRVLARDLGSVGGIVRSRSLTGPLFGIGGGAHHMGGTRMHESPDRGVVDPSGRVHGSANLYVCSSSNFPTGGFSNPTLTVVALAVRLAREIGAST